MSDNGNTVDEILEDLTSSKHFEVLKFTPAFDYHEARSKIMEQVRAEAKLALNKHYGEMMLELVGSNTQGVIRTGGVVDWKQEKYRNAVKDELRAKIKESLQL